MVVAGHCEPKKASAAFPTTDSSSFLEARGIYIVEERCARIASDFTWRLRFLGNGYSVMGYGYERSRLSEAAPRNVARFNRERWKLHRGEVRRGISRTKLRLLQRVSYGQTAGHPYISIRRLQHGRAFSRRSSITCCIDPVNLTVARMRIYFLVDLITSSFVMKNALQFYQKK